MAFKTVKIKKYVDIIEEYKANAAITPGMLVELINTGLIRKHASANSFALPMFALEDELQGKGIDDAYAQYDQVQVWIPVRGEQVYALIQDGQVIAVGDALCSAGDGTLVKALTDFTSMESINAGDDLSTKVVVGVALDAITLDAEGSDSSAAGAHYPRIRVRIV